MAVIARPRDGLAATLPAGRTTPRDREERELFHRWRELGDQRARERLIERFLPLARKLALRYVGAREPIDDLVQVASVGLVKAVDRFDVTRGQAFTSFAVPTILGELRRYFRDHGWAVHVPRRVQEHALRVEQAIDELRGRGGRSPSTTELAEYLEWELSDVLEALEGGAAHHATSFEAAYDDDERDSHLAQKLGAEDPRLAFVEDRTSVERALGVLSARERRVLELRFDDERTQAEIGAEIGVSQMQVSRILRTALARLRTAVDGASPDGTAGITDTGCAPDDHLFTPPA